MVTITECPRDAMQGIKEYIPAGVKADYINQILKVGFSRVDFGSFVSPKSIPQMKDTAEVLQKLHLEGTKSELLAIVANQRGAEDAAAFAEISFLGFPFSISETFQQRNANSSIIESLKRVEDIQALCLKNNKKLLVYLSMAFGNPYGDDWSPEIAMEWCNKLRELDIRHLALADTIGSSTPENIRLLFSSLIPELGKAELSAHMHSTREKAQEKIRAAYESGCRSFDVAIHGFGGCPMALDDLTGNIATEDLEYFAGHEKIELGLDKKELDAAYEHAWRVFNVYH